MPDLIELIQDHIPYDCFSDAELGNLIRGSQDSRYALMKRALKTGKLLHIRRGLYCLAPKYRRRSLDLFPIAQKIYGPSYISLESALSYHGWIPESVPTITSVCVKRSADFATPLGQFIYRSVSATPLLTAVDRIESESGAFLMARPWKAIADYLFVTKKDWDSVDPLIRDLRIEQEMFRKINLAELKSIRRSFQNKRVTQFLSNIATGPRRVTNER